MFAARGEPKMRLNKHMMQRGAVWSRKRSAIVCCPPIVESSKTILLLI